MKWGVRRARAKARTVDKLKKKASAKATLKAEKARAKLAKNEKYIARMNTKISKLSDEELKGAYSFINGQIKY